MKQILKALVLLIDEGTSIKRGIKQVRTISELSDGSTDYVSQKIERWKHRVNIFLKENISTEVATDFNNECRGMTSIDWYENICSPLNSGTSFLQSIKDDIEQNPEFWVNRLSKKQKNPKNFKSVRDELYRYSQKNLFTISYSC